MNDVAAAAGIDLNNHLVTHRESTFFVRVRGESMVGAGMHDVDLLVVDRAAAPADGDLVVAWLEGGMDLKRAQLRNGRLRLLPENPCRPSPCCGDDAAPDVWGVVTALVHRYRS
ncbi:MAG: LexA family transcriptional regulator [Betaproteobacteria bacterium]|nr:LexA family transcriptional regulator [Betaproteobacteria bacterium]